MKHIKIPTGKERGDYGKSSDKALEKWERDFLETTLVDELDLIIYHLQTYACLRLGESIQCNQNWLETPLDEKHRNKLIINIPEKQIDIFEKFKNRNSKVEWSPKTKKSRSIIIYNSQSVQVIKMFYNKYKYGISELFPNVNKQESIERSIQRNIEKWVKPLREECERRLKISGLNLSNEEIIKRIDKTRNKLSPHALRSSGENYLLKEKKLDQFMVANMVGHSVFIQKKNYRNAKDLLYLDDG